MGLRILAGIKVNESPDTRGAVLYCSTTGTALPWMFRDEVAAESFVHTYGDIRRLSYNEQESLFRAFLENGG